MGNMIIPVNSKVGRLALEQLKRKILGINKIREKRIKDANIRKAWNIKDNKT